MSQNQALTFHQLTAVELPSAIQQFQEVVYAGTIAEAQEHFDEEINGPSETFIAYFKDEFAGFVTLRWESHNKQFRQNNIPFIHHLQVFGDYQRQGIASALMDAAEHLIATRATHAGICVGIFDAYGPAQKLYAQRGYIPDGRGVCQWHRPIQHGEQLTIDHDLIIWMAKALI